MLKCQLEPIDYGDYAPSFNPAQRRRLEAAFPDGVCDWSKPGVEEADLAGTWQEFGPGRMVAERKRTLDLTLRRTRAEKTPQGRRRSPRWGRARETTYQEVVFEKKAKHGGWRRFATGVADGGKCRASATLELKAKKGGKAKPVRIRARADAIEGYRAARSPAEKG